MANYAALTDAIDPALVFEERHLTKATDAAADTKTGTGAPPTKGKAKK